MPRRKLTNPKMSIETARRYRDQAQRRAPHEIAHISDTGKQPRRVEWGEKIIATQCARKALARCYKTIDNKFKEIDKEIRAQQIAENNAEINAMEEFMKRKGTKNAYVMVAHFLDWTARKPIVVPLETIWSQRSKSQGGYWSTPLSGEKLHEAVAEALGLPSAACLIMRVQRPWIPYVHKASILDSSVLVSRSPDSNCKHLLAQTLLWAVIEDPQAEITSVADSDTCSDDEVGVVVERTLLCVAPAVSPLRDATLTIHLARLGLYTYLGALTHVLPGRRKAELAFLHQMRTSRNEAHRQRLRESFSLIEQRIQRNHEARSERRHANNVSSVYRQM